MTKSNYCEETYRLKSHGHAGAAQEGEKDLVCCAVTVLMTTALAALEKEGIRYEIECNEKEGLMDIIGRPKTAQQERCRAILDTIAAGLEAVAAVHRNYVSFEKFKWEVN